MFNHAIRHPVKRAHTDIRNNEGLTPLTLAAKLGRKELFLQCLELSHVVNMLNYLTIFVVLIFCPLKYFKFSITYSRIG